MQIAARSDPAIASRTETGDVLVSGYSRSLRKGFYRWIRPPTISWLSRYRLGPPKVLRTARAPVRPIVIIQSDDWGRVGIPSEAVLDEIRHLGFAVGSSPWDWYGLESVDDVDQLAATLAQFHDADGRPACVTANFVMANADLRLMAAQRWQNFCWKSIDEGFPAPWDRELMPSYRRAVEAGVFYPGLHGFTHFSSTGLMAALNDKGDLGVRARTLAERDVPYLRSLTPEYNFALARCDADGDHYVGEAAQAEWIERGIRLFQKSFGHQPLTTCAPGYRENEVTRGLFQQAGIKIVQGRHGDVPFEQEDILFLGRNLAFEPCLSENYSLEEVVAEASEIIAAGSPTIICSHSINYVSSFLGRAEFARGELARLLSMLKSRFPHLRFASDQEFYLAWTNHAGGWFREPTESEKLQRIRRYIHQTATQNTFEDEEHQSVATMATRRVSALPTEMSAAFVGSESGTPLERSVVTSRLGGQTFLVLLGSIFTLIVGFPLQIYISRVLGPGGLGTFGIIEGVVATLSGFLGLGIAQSVVRFVPFHLAQRDYGSVRAIIRLGAVILLAVGIAAYFVLLTSLESLGEWWPALIPHKSVVVLMGTMVPLGLILYFLQQSLRGFHEIKYMVAGSSVVQLTLKAIFTVTLFAVGWGLFGYALAVVLSTLSSVLWMGLGLRNKVSAMPVVPERDWQENRKQWYRYAMIAFAGGLLAFTVYLDRFILGYFVDAAAVGIFLVTRQLQQLPGTFNQMLIMVGAPMFAAAHSRSNTVERQHIYTLMTDWVVRASLPLMLFLVFFGNAVLGLYGAEFAIRGEAVLLILVAAQFINLACGPVGNLVMMSGLERAGLQINIATTVVGLVMDVVLIPYFGLIGAAFGSGLTWALLNGFLLVVAQRRLGIRWWDPRWLGWLMPTVVVSIMGLAIRESGIVLNAVELVVVLGLMYAAFGVANLAQGLHKDDKDLLRHLRLVLLRWKYA